MPIGCGHKKYIVFAPTYNDLIGGTVALHKLCHCINELGFEAYLYPMYEDKDVAVYKNRIVKMYKRFKSKRKIKRSFSDYKINKLFNYSVIYSLPDEKDQFIVVYPEVTSGNPLRAKNVVRWFLHRPGFHTGKVNYGKNELYFKYTPSFGFPEGVNICEGSVVSENLFRIAHMPLEFYNENGVSQEREGTAYCLRKGKGRPIIHDLHNSVLIDGKSHEEVSRIFKKVKTFISYDTYTAYSFFAVLCGCESVVIPDVGVTEEEWRPNVADRYGIAYGFDRLAWARETAPLVLERMRNEDEKCLERVEMFIRETQEFFS